VYRHVHDRAQLIHGISLSVVDTLRDTHVDIPNIAVELSKTKKERRKKNKENGEVLGQQHQGG
jgi:hypothetical protein